MDVGNISACGVIEICYAVEEKTSAKWTISSCDRKASEFYEIFFKDRKKKTGTSKKGAPCKFNVGVCTLCLTEKVMRCNESYAKSHL